MHVSTKLGILGVEDQSLARDFTVINGADWVIDGKPTPAPRTAYRKLDPDYYAWLRSRLELAKSAAATGKLAPQSFDALRARFAIVHRFAIDTFGEQALRDACACLDVRKYAPPVADADTRGVGVGRPKHSRRAR